MLFSLSKISDFTPQQTAWVMFCDWMMILTGYIAAVYPPGFISCEFCAEHKHVHNMPCPWTSTPA